MAALSSKVSSKKMNPKDVLAQRRSYCDEVHDTLTEKGVHFFTPDIDGSLNIDEDFLALPANITDVTSRDLGEYLNAYTQQKVYMRTLLGYAEMYAEQARLEYMTVSEKPFRDLLGSKLSETAKEREVNSHQEVRPAYEKWLDHRNQVKLLTYNIASIEDIIFMLSREVSRRTGDFADERREHNVTGR